MAFTGELPKTLAILREACDASGVGFEVVDSYSGFVVRLTKGPHSFPVCASKLSVYPINRATSASIARDKTWAHYVLEAGGFRVPPGDYFFLKAPRAGWERPPGRERADAFTYAARISDNYTKPLIAKPNAGTGAHFVSFIASETDLRHTLDVITGEDEIALVQSFVDQPEFRLFLVDGEIMFIYRKTRASIVGDGLANIRELCAALASGSRKPLDAKVLLASPFLAWRLRARGLTLESILPTGEALQVDAVSNISAGGQFTGFIEPSQPVRDWARGIARTIGLRVTGIDAFSRSELADPSDIIVTDVNGSPNLGTLHDMGHKTIVQDVWKHILHKTFDEPWPSGF
jgi:cyanophycin synthetase